MRSSDWATRIAASTTAASVGAVFAFLYNSMKANNAHWQGMELPGLTAFYAWASPWGLVVPAAVLLAGMGCLRCKTQPERILHILSYAGWLYALAWSLGCILAWEIPYLIINPAID
jgi:hypothetical protein